MNAAGWGPALLGVAALLAAAPAARAHRGHESQIGLSVQAERVQGRWSTALHDLPALLPGLMPALLPPGASAEPADEAALTRLIASRPELAAQLLARVKLAAVGVPCVVTPLRQEIVPRLGNAAWVVLFEARCPAPPARLEVDLRALFERDPKHLVLLKLEAGAWARAALFTADSARQAFQPDQTVRPPSTGNSTPVMNAASSLPR